MDIFEIMKQRYSVRQYEDKAIKLSIIEKIDS